MARSDRKVILAQGLRSLCWHGDDLVDLIGGSIRYFQDGTNDSGKTARVYAYPFDSVISHGDHAVLFEAYGLKGLLIDMREPEVVRELNRSYYHAKDYMFPIALFDLFDGRKVIASCPEEYDTIEIDEVDTGVRVTRRDRQSPDVFHSKFEASLDGRYLADNGWVWHPFNILQVFDLRKVVEDPHHLDGDGIDYPRPSHLCLEPYSAIFCGHRMVYASILEGEFDDEDKEEVELLPAEEGVPETTEERPRVREVFGSDIVITDKDGVPLEPGPTPRRIPGVRHFLQVYDIDADRLLTTREMPENLGPLMPVGEDHVVSFYDHPKLIEVMTGKVVHRWEDIELAPVRHQPSVMMRGPVGPFVATDPANKRFAVGTEDMIAIIDIQD